MDIIYQQDFNTNVNVSVSTYKKKVFSKQVGNKCLLQNLNTVMLKKVFIYQKTMMMWDFPLYAVNIIA